MKNARILLIEDDSNVVLLVSRRLRRAGYEVGAVSTIGAAREMREWDIAILDRHLPDGDGLDLCDELRAARPHAYLIVLTGDDRDHSKLKAFAAGADDYITKPFNFDELEARVRAGARIVELQKRLQELSMTDSLTSLRNRRAFDEHLSSSFEQARRHGRPLSLALIDVDRFKPINDTFGHDVGDAVLRDVGQIIAGGIRLSDFLARVGGEEFGVLLPETTLFEGLQFAEKLRANLAASAVRVGEEAHQLTVSIGLANVPHSRVGDASELYRAADQALYRAKHNGRNRVEMERRTRVLPRAATPLRSDPRSPQPSVPPTLQRTPATRCP